MHDYVYIVVIGGGLIVSFTTITEAREYAEDLDINRVYTYSLHSMERKGWHNATETEE